MAMPMPSSPSVIGDSWRDIRHGLRLLWRSPGFTTAALLTLAIGIGATAAVFGVVRAVILEPLPYRDPDGLVAIWETNRGGTTRNVIAPANFVAWRERTRTLDHLGMVGPTNLVLSIDGTASNVSGLNVSADVFAALGVTPVMGRAYTAEEDFGGSSAVIVLSHEFWQNRLGGRDVLGTALATGSGPVTVVGVMPPGFTMVGQKADFMIPYGQSLEQLRAALGRGNSYAIARRRDGVAFSQAADEMRAIFADLEREFPQRNARRTVMLFPLQEQMVGEVRPALIALTAAVGLVLLVGCVNIANLLLARSAAREREIGVRTALGAGRERLVRQMLTESLVLAGGGGLAGLGVAVLCHRGLLALVGDRIPIPRLEQTSIDLTVVAFTLVAALVTGIAFGVVPAFVSTTQARDAMRDGGRHGGGRRRHRVLRSLVVFEVALSLMLLAGAGLLMRSLVKLQSVDLGFRVDGVLTAGVQVPTPRYDFPAQGVFFTNAMASVAALPGVVSVAGGSCQPVPFACIGTGFWRADQPRPADGQVPSGQVRPVTPNYFNTLGIPTIAGRDFSDADLADSTPVAIIGQAIVSRHFPDGSPLGRRIRIAVNHVSGREDVEWTIVGVVGDTRSTLDGPVRETIFIPRSQRPSGAMTMFVRSEQEPLALASSVRAVVQTMEPEAPVNIRTLAEVVGNTIARPRAISILVGAFAIVALVLAAVGVYGVMSYSIKERTQEIGIRMALGASAAVVFRMVLGQAMRLIAAGVVAGLLASMFLTRLLGGMLFEVGPLDPATFAATSLALLAVAALAAYVPARRSMRMAPVEALRTE
jgi:putative ABC transport system permease protein